MEAPLTASGGAPVERLVDQMSAIVVTCDAAWRITHVNPAALALLERFGATVAALQGRDIWDALPMLRGTVVHEAAARARHERAEVELEVHARQLGRWFQLTVTPAPDGLLAMAQDITERKRREIKLRDDAELLGAVVHGAADCVFVKDLAGRYVMFNAAAAEAMGLDASTITGRTDAELFAPEIAQVLRDNDRSVVSERRTHIFEERLVRDGTERYFLSTKAVYRNAAGRMAGVIGIARDITERRRAEERQRFLADASGVINASLDYETTLAAVARLALPRFADYCVVDLVDENGNLQRVEFAHVDPEKEQRVGSVVRRYPPDPHWVDHPIAEAIRTGEPVFMPDLQPLLLPTFGPTDEYRECVAYLAPRSLISVPLENRGHVLGALTFCFSDSRRVYREEDLGLARELATRGALAVENARLFRAAQLEVAQRTQAEAELRAHLVERERAQQQLLQVQKMEAVGRLAGGIAHDFNNMLMIIIGFTDFLLGATEAGDARRQDVEEIKKAAERASALTRQLLALGRHQLARFEVVDLNHLLGELVRMIRPLLGEEVECITHLAPDLSGVRADRGQLEQVLMNLAINARDAMPRGGTLTLETSSVQFAEGEAYRAVGIDIPAGQYVVLRVRDTGIGMDAATKARIFEPFFTTKGSAQNSGLGLAMVYGIVAQSRGHIWVESEADRGTTFSICLPRAQRRVSAPEAGTAPVRGGSETILVVEDEEAVRALACRVLRQHGYRTIEAADGVAALGILDEEGERIALLLTDVVMPAMSGPELAKIALTRHRGLRLLFMSGYTDSEVLRRGLQTPGVRFLQKPFSPDNLARKVRAALEEPAPELSETLARE